MIRLIILLFFLIGVVSCQMNENKEGVGEEWVRADTVKNDYANAFRIIYHPQDVQIDILEPTTQEVIIRYFVGRNDSKDLKAIPFSPSRVVTTSTTQMGMLHKLNLNDRVTGVSSYTYLCHPVNHDFVVEVGEMGFTDAEMFIQADADLIFYSGYDMNDPILAKLDQAKKKTFLIYEWRENHPLGRAEWIQVYGTLFQKEQEANAIYEEVKMAYKKTEATLKKANERPTLFAGTPLGDVFNAPAGESYMAKLLEDANIDYVYAKTKGTGSLSLSMEQIIIENANTSFWINANAKDKMELLDLNPKFKLLKATQNGKLFSYVENGNCFWENSAIEPHLILEDLGRIAHPELFEKGNMNYYTKIR